MYISIIRACANALILVPQQHNEVSPTEVCQLLVFYGVESRQSSIFVRRHNVRGSYNIVIYYGYNIIVLFYECDDHTLININVHVYQTK